ncbi:MAG: PDZ domain-containing protein, partial [Candidatus Omnitrophota bacterium]
DRQGALVMKVLEGSPAQKAGFKEGDVIKKFAGQACMDVKSLLREINKMKVGDIVDVEVIRERQKQILQVEVGERSDEIKEPEPKVQAASWRGIEVVEMTPEIARRFNLGAAEGVVVTRVAVNSVAAEAGIMPGDVIVAIDRDLIKNPGDYQKAISAVQGDALVRTERGFVVIKAEETR